MSTTNDSNKSRRGGARPGAGRGGGDKTKISVSVDEDNWQTALSMWRNKPSSWLVDMLIADYVNGEELSQKARSA